MKHVNRSSRQGQTLVEFALLIPVFLLIVVVVFDLGRAVYYYSTISNAAREATRFGVHKTQRRDRHENHSHNLCLWDCFDE